MTSFDFHPLSPWHRMPLCRRYCSVHLASWQVSVGQSDLRATEVRVALGAHADGDVEVLGVWLAMGSAAQAWRVIFSDLLAHGLEATSFVVGAEPNLDFWPRAKRLPAAATVLRQASRTAGRRDMSGTISVLLRDASSTGVGPVSFAKLLVDAFNCKRPEGLQASLWALGELSPLLSLASRQRRVILAAEAASAEAGRCVELGTYPSVDLVEDRANSLVVGALRRADRPMARRMQVEERAQYSSMP